VGLTILLLAKKSRAAYQDPLSYSPARLIYEGGTYQTTWDDWLWMARACYGEDNCFDGQSAVSWCMLQRFAARAQAGRKETLTALIRSFSQPVNPIWSSVEGCRDGRGCCGQTMGACSPEKLQRRSYIQSRDWSWFEENQRELLELVLSFAQGMAPGNDVPGYTNFAASYTFAQNCSPGEGKRIGGNCFVYGSPPLRGRVVVEGVSSDRGGW